MYSVIPRYSALFCVKFQAKVQPQRVLELNRVILRDFDYAAFAEEDFGSKGSQLGIVLGLVPWGREGIREASGWKAQFRWLASSKL